MITIKFDQQFQTDFKRISRRIPQIVTELEYVIEAIEEYGHVPESYNPHMLDRPRDSAIDFRTIKLFLTISGLYMADLEG